MIGQSVVATFNLEKEREADPLVVLVVLEVEALGQFRVRGNTGMRHQVANFGRHPVGDAETNQPLDLSIGGNSTMPPKKLHRRKNLHYTASLKKLYRPPALFNPLVPGMQNTKIRQFIIDCLLIVSDL